MATGRKLSIADQWTMWITVYERTLYSRHPEFYNEPINLDLAELRRLFESGASPAATAMNEIIPIRYRDQKEWLRPSKAQNLGITMKPAYNRLATAMLGLSLLFAMAAGYWFWNAMNQNQAAQLEKAAPQARLAILLGDEAPTPSSETR